MRIPSCIYHCPLHILCTVRVSDVASGLEVEKHRDKHYIEEETGVVCHVCNGPVGWRIHMSCSQRAFQSIWMGQSRSLARIFLHSGWINRINMLYMGDQAII